MPSSTCILIESINGDLRIDTTNFVNNAATNTSYGLVFVEVDQIKILDSNWYLTNVFSPLWMNRLETPNFIDPLTNVSSKELMIRYFDIRSSGSCVYG